jgi:hypothetical protein
MVRVASEAVRDASVYSHRRAMEMTYGYGFSAGCMHEMSSMLRGEVVVVLWYSSSGGKRYLLEILDLAQLGI